MALYRFISQNDTGQYQNIEHRKAFNPQKSVQYDDNFLTTVLRLEESEHFNRAKNIELHRVYQALNYKNEAVLEIGADIIAQSIEKGITDIKISKTGEDELLIFRETNGTFNNIIIDEDADVEFLSIPNDRAKTYNEHYPFISNFSVGELVSKL